MERTVDILIEISIYSAVITAFILLFRAAFKKRISPKVQYAMWLLLVLRLMLPVTIESGFHVESLLPERPVPVVQEESISDSPVISEMPAVNMAPATDTAPVQPSFDTQNQESAPAVSQEIPESTVVSIAEVKEPIFNIRWRIVAFWAWVAGAMAFGLWMMIVKLRFYEDMQQNIASVSPRTYAIYDECCAALKVKPLTMWAVDRAISPGIAFFTYPVLLLPASMDGDEEKLRYAFLHELTHKKRHDHHMTALLTALRIIYWFNPAVHIGFSEMRSDMETACDAEVIAFVGREQKRGYLTAILELFSYATRPQLGMSQASSRRMAKQRMKGAFMRERTTFLGRAAALMLAVILLVGCFTTACRSAPVEVEEVHEETAEAVEPENTPEVNLDEVKTEVWKETYTAGGWLPVSVDTVMDIPLYVNFPVYKMEYYDFTTGKLKHMADKLLGSPTKVALLNDYSEADEPAPSETELSINGQYIYVDSHGQEWSVRSGSRGVNIAKYFPEGALIQTEETVMQGEAYPGEPAGTTIGVQRTWQEAYQYVLDAMDKLGIVNMTLVNYEKARLINSSNEIISKGWNFTLSREDGGRITFYNGRPSAVLMDFEDPEVPLNKEVIRVFVDEAGIENIMWNNPSNVISIITDTHMPFTFEETKGTIKKAFEAIASYTKGRYPDYAITIEDIDLRSCPVQSEADASTGYLVPAWVMDLTIGEGDAANNHSWLCVSTIDGSIISHAYMTEAGKRIAQNYDSGLYYEQMGEKERESFRDAILRLYPLADEIAAKGFTAVPGEGWLEESEALFQTVGLRLAGAGGAVMDYLGYTVETPDEYCSNDLCHMYAAVLFASVPNLYEINIGNADFITYNTYLDKEHEHLLATAVGDVISREDTEKHWSGLKKPLLEEYGTSGSGIRELLSELANLSGIDLASAELALDTPLHVSLLQPTPALDASNPEWQAAERIAAPFSETGKRIDLSYYEVSIDLNGTERISAMTENNVTPDQFDRTGEGQTLLLIYRASADAINDSSRMEDLFLQFARISRFETVTEFIQLDHTAYFGADSPVYRMDKMTSVMDIAEPGWNDTAYTTYFVYLTSQWDYRGQTQSQNIVLGFRFVNAVRGDIGGWKLLQAEADCEKWMDTVEFGDAFASMPKPMPTPATTELTNAIVANAKALVGKPYKKGTYGPDTFDSAGFVYYVLFNEGIEVTKQSCQEYSTIGSWKKIEDKADLQPGDILFFYSDDFTEINHAGIYIGNSKMIDASSANGKVTERSWETDYWQEHFAFARRVA